MGVQVVVDFAADHPDQLWVSDFTYIQTNSGWVYTAFIIDVFSRAIVGWKVSTRMNTDIEFRKRDFMLSVFLYL